MSELEPPSAREAYRALHLLPSAPAELAEAVYAYLQLALRSDANAGRRLEELHRAYAALRASPTAAPPTAPASARSPWELLHLDAAAPGDVVEVAYRFRRQRSGSDGVSPRAERVAVHAAEGAHREVDLSPPLLAYLLEAEGGQLVVGISGAPVRIGTDAGCDVVVAAGTNGGRAEARIWHQRDRFLLHAVGAPGLVLVNDQPAAWAVLEHGDRLLVGEASFRFERAADGRANAVE